MVIVGHALALARAQCTLPADLPAGTQFAAGNPAECVLGAPAVICMERGSALYGSSCGGLSAICMGRDAHAGGCGQPVCMEPPWGFVWELPLFFVREKLWSLGEGGGALHGRAAVIRTGEQHAVPPDSP